MNKVFTLFFMAFLLGFNNNNIFAQNPQFSVDGGTVSNAFPLSSATNNRSQFLILASEIGNPSPGEIKSIYILPGTNRSTASFTDFTVKIGMTNLTELSGNSWEGGLTTVVSNTNRVFTNVINEQWLEIPLDSLMNYDGISNIIIELSQTDYVFGFSIRLNNDLPNRRRYQKVSSPTGTLNLGRL